MADKPWYRDGPIGSATTAEDRDQQILRARRLEGRKILAVRYFTLDYERLERPPKAPAPRLVTDPSEIADPTWRYHNFDSVDFYIELMVDEEQVFTIGWDPPPVREGLWLHEGSTGGEPFASSSPVAIWDASGSSQWASTVGGVVDTVEPRYRLWGESAGYWCDQVNNLLTLTDPASLRDWLAD